MTYYNFITHNGERYYKIGFNTDGSLYNPNDYPETIVRGALEGAAERKRQRKADAIKRAVATRKARRERQINVIAEVMLLDLFISNRQFCVCCKKVLTDPESVDRGVGSECWQHVLQAIQRLQKETGDDNG